MLLFSPHLPAACSLQMFHTIVPSRRTMAVTGTSSPNNDTTNPPPPPERRLERGGEGVLAGANRAVSLASEPAEELIKGWDCRLEQGGC